jgi:CheY-like chemotaxis protein
VTKTALIADDSAAVRLSVRLLLQGRHKELLVREAFDGMDAIEKAKRSKPDLILLDLAMPRVNGAEAATVLKNDLPYTPVILFTYTDLHADSLCSAIGVDFISKVDGIPKLLERVDSLLLPTLPERRSNAVVGTPNSSPYSTFAMACQRECTPAHALFSDYDSHL